MQHNMRAFSERNRSFRISRGRLGAFRYPLASTQVESVTSEFSLAHCRTSPLRCRRGNLRIGGVNFNACIGRNRRRGEAVGRISCRIVCSRRGGIAISLTAMERFTCSGGVGLIGARPRTRDVLGGLGGGSLHGLLSSCQFASTGRVIITVGRRKCRRHIHGNVRAFSGSERGIDVERGSLVGFTGPGLIPRQVASVVDHFGLCGCELSNIFCRRGKLGTGGVSFGACGGIPVRRINSTGIVTVLGSSGGLGPSETSTSSSPRRTRGPHFTGILGRISCSILFSRRAGACLPMSSVHGFTFSGSVTLVSHFERTCTIPGPSVETLLRGPRCAALGRVGETVESENCAIRASRSNGCDCAGSNYAFSVSQHSLLTFAKCTESGGQRAGERSEGRSADTRGTTNVLNNSINRGIVGRVLNSGFHARHVVTNGTGGMIDIVGGPTGLGVVLLGRVNDCLGPFGRL